MEHFIGWNIPYVKGVSKADFIKDHKHAYPGVDLGAVWDSHNPKKKVIK